MTRLSRIFKKVLLCAALITAFALFLNAPATTRQGIEGTVFVRTIPLYVKLCGFLYRNYQYGELSGQIVGGIKGDKDKIRALYRWAAENIKRPPKGFPLVDDHIWDIIVRRYGTPDQIADVFTTLASYAGYEAFWEKLETDDAPEELVLSFVKIGDNWHIFDLYDRKSFISAETMALPTPYGPSYGEYLRTMDRTKFAARIRRPGKQKIATRVIYEFKNFFKPSQAENDRK